MPLELAQGHEFEEQGVYSGIGFKKKKKRDKYCNYTIVSKINIFKKPIK